MPPLRLAFAVAVLAAGPLFAADDAPPTRGKAGAVANLQKAGVDKPAVVETDTLLVAGTLPEPRLTAVAAGAEKVAAVARKALGYAPADKPFPHKLAVYVFADRKPFNAFMLQVAGERAKDTSFQSLAGDDPFVVLGVNVGEKVVDADLAADAGRRASAALLVRKGGAPDYPEWMKLGFGRAALARSDGPTAKRMTEFRTKAKAVVGGKGGPVKVSDLWAEESPANADVIGASVMDYLAFGPGNADLPKLLAAFKPAENMPEPSVNDVFTKLKWKPDDLDAKWKKYVQTGK